MNRRVVWLIIVAAVIIVGLLTYVGSKGTLSILEPAGPIATQQRDIIRFAAILSVIIVVPVFALTFFIVWKYRASNHESTYKPEWDGNRALETIWWLVPGILITILAVTAYRTSHSLDPMVAIHSDQKPLNVQVVAMTWKWLFIYPEQGVASVNRLEMPTGRPVHFDITADAPMNSFWIPQLGGQIYAMPGMSTQLNLLADKSGSYRGSSANISGRDFASMVFVAHATSPKEFSEWVINTRQGNDGLTPATYAELAKPGTSGAKMYNSVTSGLYADIVDKYMGHKHQEHNE